MLSSARTRLHLRILFCGLWAAVRSGPALVFDLSCASSRGKSLTTFTATYFHLQHWTQSGASSASAGSCPALSERWLSQCRLNLRVNIFALILETSQGQVIHAQNTRNTNKTQNIDVEHVLNNQLTTRPSQSSCTAQ